MISTTTGVSKCRIYRIQAAQVLAIEDQLAGEEPLEIRLQYGSGGRRNLRPVAVTMRTPGYDIDLALGFLFSEAIIGKVQDVLDVEHFPDRNIVSVALDPRLPFDMDRLDRHFYTTSSCGVCGKGALELVESVTCYFPQPHLPKIPVEVIYTLPKSLESGQSIFARTGGIHAAGLFDTEGNLLALREDVGRHNAVDKLIGWAFQHGHIPLREQVLVLSGRIGFELVQKAAMAGIPVIAAVGAPSSLAVALAEESDMTLIGFLRQDRMNVYCGMERISISEAS